MGDVICMKCWCYERTVYGAKGCPLHVCMVCDELGSADTHPECAAHLDAIRAELADVDRDPERDDHCQALVRFPAPEGY